ncbi:MAG TPA: efflux RND transporter periplasmic adaptor subunit [Steroidobacteraceae bacterium]|nr:efflux RND transporter periplasmic adaptor subunit [Steroidobacteraceae bacterium]
MSSENDNKALLQQLRIDRTASAADTGGPRRYWLIGSALALLLLLGLLWFTLARTQALPVHVAAARPIPGGAAASASVLDATGYVTARREATVSAQITGTITAVLIEEGDHVKEGQVIGRLDDTAQRAALTQAQASLAAARSQLIQDQAQLAQSVRDLRRAEDLVKRNLVSEQAVELARTQVDTQSAQLEGQKRLIDLAAANVRSAQVQLDYCTVRAPFTGVVIAKSAQVGEIVSPFSAGGGFTRTGIGTIVDMDSLEIEVDVNEAYINRVQPGQKVESVLNAYPEWRIPSHVIAIIPTADRSKATVKVRIGLDLKDNRIVPDMGVRVSFLEAAAKAGEAGAAPPPGVLVPVAALRTEGTQDVVYVLTERKAQRRIVTLGGTMDGARQVLSGLAPGEAVITDPPPQLKDGAAVSVAKS